MAVGLAARVLLPPSGKTNSGAALRSLTVELMESLLDCYSTHGASVVLYTSTP